jgi:hypothetical protein
LCFHITAGYAAAAAARIVYQVPTCALPVHFSWVIWVLVLSEEMLPNCWCRAAAACCCRFGLHGLRVYQTLLYKGQLEQKQVAEQVGNTQQKTPPPPPPPPPPPVLPGPVL